MSGVFSRAFAHRLFWPVLMLVAHGYERRDSLGAPEAATPAGVSALLAPYREVRL